MTAPKIFLEINQACDRWPADLIDKLQDIAQIVAAHTAADWPGGPTDISLLLTDDDDMAALNKAWRDKDGPTNVLSFPAAADMIDPETGHEPLGDIAIGLSIAAREAAAQGKSLETHSIHLWVHGLLHLLGYDHIDDNDAQVMEGLEISILAQLGIDDPYKD